MKLVETAISDQYHEVAVASIGWRCSCVMHEAANHQDRFALSSLIMKSDVRMSLIRIRSMGVVQSIDS